MVTAEVMGIVYQLSWRVPATHSFGGESGLKAFDLAVRGSLGDTKGANRDTTNQLGDLAA